MSFTRIRALLTEQEDNFERSLGRKQTEVDRLTRINHDLKDALREALCAPAIKDSLLAEAMVRGVAEDGSIKGRYIGA